MRCPKCAQKVTKQKLPDGSSVFFCDACGWGQDRLENIEQSGGTTACPEPVTTAKTWLKLLLFWLLSLLVVFAPFALIVFGVPLLVQKLELNFVTTSPEKIAAALHPAYWIVIGVYILLSNLFSPQYEPDNLGLFGRPYIDNPFSYEDDYNRTMRTMAFLLYPGKVVGYTVVGTVRVIKHLVS